MTKYQTMFFQRAVKKSLREKNLSARAKNYKIEKKETVELPKYITDNPFYP